MEKAMYTNITTTFLNSIEALRYYIESVELPSLSSLDADDKNTFLAVIMYLAKELKIEHKNVDDIEFPEEMSQESLDDVKKCITEMTSFFDVSQDGKSGRFTSIPVELKKPYKKIESTIKQNEILYSGSLLLLMTYFENTISKILKNDFQRHPERMSLENKSVSYKILEKAENIQDIKNHLIEEEVISIMYKSVSDWIEYFKRTIKLKLEYITEVLPQLKEVIARRNIIVHNDSIVNNIYLNSIKETRRATVKCGDILSVNKEYVLDAVDLIENVCMSLITEMWVNEFGRNEDEMKKIIGLIFDEYLTFEKWENARILYEICLKSKKLNDANELMCKINRWQCYKWQNRFAEVKDDVLKQDISACSPQFKLAIMALLDNYTEFFEYYEKQSEIGEAQLKSWPLFRKIRECSIYKEKYEIDCKCIEKNH